MVCHAYDIGIGKGVADEVDATIPADALVDGGC